MYNGIGLNTARGSGTNGYVQTNKAFLRPQRDKVDYKSEEALQAADQLLFKEPNKDILAHERKRQVEVKCLEMEDLMQQQGYSESEIQQKVTTFRQFLSKKELADKSLLLDRDDSGRWLTRSSHETACATQHKNSQLKNALGISQDYVEGSAMSKTRLTKEQTAKEERLQREKDKELTQWIKSDDSDEEVEEKHSKKKNKKEKKKKSQKKTKNKDRSRSRSRSPDREEKERRSESKKVVENNRRPYERRDPPRHEDRRDPFRHEDRRDPFRHEDRRDPSRVEDRRDPSRVEDRRDPSRHEDRRDPFRHEDRREDHRDQRHEERSSNSSHRHRHR